MGGNESETVSGINVPKTEDDDDDGGGPRMVWGKKGFQRYGNICSGVRHFQDAGRKFSS